MRQDRAPVIEHDTLHMHAGPFKAPKAVTPDMIDKNIPLQCPRDRRLNQSGPNCKIAEAVRCDKNDTKTKENYHFRANEDADTETNS